MGVQGAFAYLLEQGFEGDQVDPAQENTHIHVDVLSMYFSYITATMTSLLFRVFREQTSMTDTSEQVRASLGASLTTLLHYKLSRSFKMDCVTLHFDGEASSQKAVAHTSRAAVFEANKTRALDAASLSWLHLTLPGGPEPAVQPAPRSQIKRVVRSFKSAIQIWRSAKSLHHETRGALMGGLTALGWTVCFCTHEADVCISTQPAPVTVATSDSDFLFHGVATLLRQDPLNRTIFRCYRPAEIWQHLGLSRTMVIVLATVTKNDYVNNVKGYGIGKNLDLIKSLPNVANLDHRRLLAAYCSHLANLNHFPQGQTVLSPRYFRNAEDIFLRRLEVQASQQQQIAFPSVVELDDQMRDMIYAVSRFFSHNRILKQMAVQVGTPVSGTLLPALTALSVISRSASAVSSPGSSSSSSRSPGSSSSSSSSTGSSSPSSYPFSYKQLMPSNTYSVTTYTRSQQNVVENRMKDRRKKSARIKRKAKPEYNPSSKKTRADPSAAPKGGTPKSTTPTALFGSSLSSKYGVISMNCGTVLTRLAKSLPQNLQVTGDARYDQLPRLIARVIREMVHIQTETTRCAQQAISVHIAHVLESRPGMADADVLHRQSCFSQYTHFQNNTFFKNLLTDIYGWHDTGTRRQGRPRHNTEANQLVVEITQRYRQLLANAGLDVPRLKDYLSSGVSHLLTEAGSRLADQVQAHFLRNTSELVSRLLRYNAEWCEGAGANVIGSIDLKTGRSSRHDQVSLFWILNSNLPPGRRMRFLAESPFTDTFCTITELTLVETIYSLNERHHVQPIIDRLGHSVANAHEYIAAHPGELIYDLFFDDKLAYSRYTAVLAQDPPHPKLQRRWPLCYKKSDRQRFTQLSEAMMNDRDDRGRQKPENKRELWTFLDGIMPKADQNREIRDNQKTKIKYVLTGTLVTNGYELRVLAHSLTVPKPPSFQVPNTTRRKLVDVKMMLASEGHIQQEFPDQSSFTVVGIDPGIRSTATATIISSNNENVMQNISIPRSADAFSTKMFQRGLQRAKQQRYFTDTTPQNQGRLNVQQIEQLIQPVQCDQAPAGQAQTWAPLSASVRAHVVSMARVQQPLRAFYSSGLFKVKTMHLKQARTASLDKGISHMCNAAGLATKLGQDGAKPLFVVGDGEFGSSRGPVLHQRFISFLKKKVVAHRGAIAYADEYRTSRVCCQCRTEGKLVMRAIQCPGCSQERDRDHNGATNMALATLCLLNNEAWPVELQRGT